MLLESVSDTTIEHNFWSSDKTGLDVLLHKLEESNKSTIAIQQYFSTRAQIEEEYGNALLKLSQSYEVEDRFSTISTASEMSARAHLDLSQNIRNMLQIPLENYMKEQESIKIFMTNQMKESQNMKILHGDNVQKTRQLYVNECQKPHASFKDIDTLDCEYQKAIKLMQSNSNHWIHDWRESCKTFQSLELNRLDYLKAVIKTYSSMIACTCNIDDQTGDRMLIEMDDMNAIHEITKFVRNHRTGTIIPEIPKYTKYKKSDDIKLTVYTPNPREIREINIPVKKDEELRSVDDQLKKIPNPWERKASTSSVIKLQKDQVPIRPHEYPLDPIYKCNRKNPSQSDPILNTRYQFQQTPTKKEEYYNKSHEQDTFISKHNGKYTTPPLPLPSTPTKKPSMLRSSLGFLKKKKKAATVPANRVDHSKKRLSLGLVHQSSTNDNILTPPSPMFSPIDFYYSPATIDK